MDVKNAFLHGNLKETVYLRVPDGLDAPPNFVCHLLRSLYGLKQAPRAWFEKFCHTLIHYGFKQSHSDHSLFIQRTSRGITIFLVYVDDIIISGSDSYGIQHLQQILQSSFHMKDLGALTYFLVLEVHRSDRGTVLTQTKYTQELIDMARLTDCKPVNTPMEVNVKYHKHYGDPISDPTLYRKLVGSLIYLTSTRPDISYAVNIVIQYMSDPRHHHLAAVFRILRYLHGTLGRGFFFHLHIHCISLLMLMLIGQVVVTLAGLLLVGACF